MFHDGNSQVVEDTDIRTVRKMEIQTIDGEQRLVLELVISKKYPGGQKPLYLHLNEGASQKMLIVEPLVLAAPPAPEPAPSAPAPAAEAAPPEPAPAPQAAEPPPEPAAPETPHEAEFATEGITERVEAPPPETEEAPASPGKLEKPAKA